MNFTFRTKNFEFKKEQGLITATKIMKQEAVASYSEMT